MELEVPVVSSLWVICNLRAPPSLNCLQSKFFILLIPEDNHHF